MLKRTVVGGVLVLLLAALPVVASAVSALRLGHNGSADSLYQFGAAKFAAAINESLKGKVEVKVFPKAELGTDEQVIKGIKLGKPELALVSTILGAVEAKLNVFEMPYLVTSRAQMKKAIETKKIQAALFDGLPGKGMRVLGVWENGFRHMTNNLRPVSNPEDLKGMKLRIPSGAWRAKMFRAYGAAPMPMPLGDVHAALKAGSMDGQENPLSQIASNKFHEVQKYLSMTGHVYSPAFLLVSEDGWTKLSQDVQAAILKIAAEIGDATRAEGERLDKALVSKLAPPMAQNDAQKAAFIKASASLYEDFGREVAGGKDLISAFQSIQ